MKGFQLPDFSLRSQTFCYTADFSTTFYIFLKPRLFAHSIIKPLASTLKFKNFDSHLQNISVAPNKSGKSGPTKLVPPVHYVRFIFLAFQPKIRLHDRLKMVKDISAL